MKTTKHPYLKEILKTTAKVALLATGTVLATTCAFGFAAGFVNLLAAGYAAGGVVAGIGAVATLKTLVKDVWTMRKRVKQQQRDEKIDNVLERLDRREQKNAPKMIQPRQNQQTPVKKRQLDFWKMRRMKDYDRAA